MNDVTLSAEALSDLYEGYLDPATGWFPDRFMHELHEVCAAVYSALLHAGGDAVDLGANRGLHTRRMAESLGQATGRIVAVEGNAELARQLAEAMEADRRVRVLHKAVVAIPTRAVNFTRSRKYIELGSVLPGYIRDNFPHLLDDAELETEAVEAMTLDQIIDEQALEDLRFVKCDVEGIDFDVVNSSRLLWQRRAGLCVENNYESPLRFELFDKLGRADYQAYDCFMNRLDAATWLEPRRSPIDRFALPAELSGDVLRTIRDAVARRWNSYGGGVAVA